MNEGMKYGLFFLGGLALGALGATAVSRGKLDFKPLAADLISKGMDARDAVMARVETARENMEDLMAEARHAAEQRKEARAVAPDVPPAAEPGADSADALQSRQPA